MLVKPCLPIMSGGYQEAMEILVLILLILALVCFLLAAFGVAVPARVNLVALGLAAWVTTAIIAWAAAH